MQDPTQQIAQDLAQEQRFSTYESNVLALLSTLRREQVTDACCAAWLAEQQGSTDAALQWVRSTRDDLNAMFRRLELHIALDRAEQREMKGDQSPQV